MDFLNSFKTELFSTKKTNFEEKALALFQFQSKHNQIYNKYIHFLGIDPNDVNEVHQIPFLPISFFKRHKVITNSWNEEQIFQSSGTTGTTTSKHYVYSVNEYLANAQFIFKQHYGAVENYHFLALLPSYLERNNSSLIFMVDHFIKGSKSSLSGFYLNNFDELEHNLKKAYSSERKVMLIGVTFGLLDFVEHYHFNMPELVVMETGGMKGRRKEMVREELHAIFKEKFAVPAIHSEYGMTELLSQAYSKGEGRFNLPPTMKILIRDINDPFSYQSTGRNGGINVIDLANTDSCAFIETQDLGKVNSDNTFEVLGRFDNSDIRGCNLMVS
ncbi:MAG: acyl transferase [Cyclobacteriaceae bacterium]|nr:acyl transferase [Cyclobacteriaceae bacterium]